MFFSVLTDAGKKIPPKRDWQGAAINFPLLPSPKLRESNDCKCVSWRRGGM